MSTSETLVPSAGHPVATALPFPDPVPSANAGPLSTVVTPIVPPVAPAMSSTLSSTAVDVLEAQLGAIEQAILVLAGAIRDQRRLLTADIDDIVAHQVVAVRDQVRELASRVPAPAPATALPAPQADPDTPRRQARRATSRGRPRGQLLIPSLFLLGGLAGGATVGLSPYTVGAARCEGPLAVSVAAVRGQAVPVPVEACDQAAADRMLLATVPALGGVMAAVAMVVMRESPRPRPKERTAAASA